MRFDQAVKQVLLLCVCLFALTGQAIANPQPDTQHDLTVGEDDLGLKKVDAMLDTGVDYEVGRNGVTQNFKEAVKWYRMAAEQGSNEAQRDLYVMFVEGKGVEKDLVRAHMWANLAATDRSSQYLTESTMRTDFIKWAISKRNVDIVKLMRPIRDELAKRMTAKQIAEAQELARKCTANKFKGC